MRAFDLFPIAATLAAAATTPQYEYIVVGSGAGGILASRLAIAGHKTLLIEAGDDQAGNLNVTVPGYQGLVTQDKKIRWDVFVNHYKDQERAKKDPKYVYETGAYEYVTKAESGSIPAGAKPKGILYPRAATLGGCITHNALIWVEPHLSDWDKIQKLTGDAAWNSAKIHRKYLNRLYEWLPVGPASTDVTLGDDAMVQHYAAAAALMGVAPPTEGNTTQALKATLQAVNVNAPTASRDSTQGIYQMPMTQKNGARFAVREFIEATVKAGYPLTVQPDTHVTKIKFSTKKGTKPKAVGVEYRRGKYLYRASPLSGNRKGKAGSVLASKEVIISGGAFNTPQILKLSGIGPAAELKKHKIDVLVDLPGVGTNLQDRYEIPVTVKHTTPFVGLDGCTFDSKPSDLCLKTWLDNTTIKDTSIVHKGGYTSNGVALTMTFNTNTTGSSDIDLIVLGGPINFFGYLPNGGDLTVRDHRYFTWSGLRAHSHNVAGTVTLRSKNPLVQPEVNFNYFDTGTKGGAASKDLAALVKSVRTAREAYQGYDQYSSLGGTAFEEMQPGKDVQSDEDIEEYIKENSWGHHACCTAKMGAKGDKTAVLDSEFRVMGTRGLRVVDASVFPKIPGIFLQAPVMMIAERAADVILGK
ncbi:Cellobiose dehydrogenase [Sphaceloma murrayae]|uniref:Cellobiose dehydrogenase n=1 Tax=Sphaceloma murrayae TaxID=2082308 RepID=A0A2K1QSG3_9PEZI|nr:Cellobiose dehydrogenase [Sphaceloma murrayae]